MRADSVELQAEGYREGNGERCCRTCLHSDPPPDNGYWCSLIPGRFVQFTETRPNMLCDGFSPSQTMKGS